ncbi:DUF423 domain-containing protein [Rhizobium mayense]|uniref:DUF423 domain-containing protein n=1 Tax=Rhizobium mayense TaxID=1312184 RepID=A0ABT7K5K5_9HYPH|nr:DUF423 domain-containing protein [Rhizobium mayense]MDL2403900.1 DUF423 domain-containing protein [Rhizobium mayense]
MSFSAAIRPLTLFIAGLLGGAGVALAAAASHGGDAHFLGSASTMCLAHAPALLALYVGYDRIRTAPVAAMLLGLGTLIFAGDLVIRHFGGNSLFPLAAPTGGLGMIAGWAVVALGALFKGPVAET